jgi:hypothetical protein
LDYSEVQVKYIDKNAQEKTVGINKAYSDPFKSEKIPIIKAISEELVKVPGLLYNMLKNNTIKNSPLIQKIFQDKGWKYSYDAAQAYKVEIVCKDENGVAISQKDIQDALITEEKNLNPSIEAASEEEVSEESTEKTRTVKSMMKYIIPSFFVVAFSLIVLNLLDDKKAKEEDTSAKNKKVGKNKNKEENAETLKLAILKKQKLTILKKLIN